MVNAGIFDGDFIAVAQTPVAHNGEIVVALLEDSATVKTFYKEKRASVFSQKTTAWSQSMQLTLR